MRLRTYLIRRAIHTVITLLVVLVLLFIIFRLQPGDPTRFFIAPGQPPQVRDELCDSFVYNFFPSDLVQQSSHPAVKILDVTMSASGRPARPSLPDAAPGEPIRIRAQVKGSSAPTLSVLKPGNPPMWAVPLT